MKRLGSFAANKYRKRKNKVLQVTGAHELFSSHSLLDSRRVGDGAAGKEPDVDILLVQRFSLAGLLQVPRDWSMAGMAWLLMS